LIRVYCDADDLFHSSKKLGTVSCKLQNA